MKTLLVGINSKYIHPSMSLYQIKKNSNYPCDLIEFTIKDDINHMINSISETLEKDNFILICFSCYLWNIEKVLEISKIIKEKFPIKVCLGGPEVSFDSLEFLSSFPYIDYIVKAEGENATNELIESLLQKRNLSDVSNLSYIEKGIFYSNEIKPCDLAKIKLATLMTKDLENQIVYLESSRGCPFKCAYCTASLDNKLRFFPLNEVLDILKTLMLKKAKVVKFLDRTFNANKQYMLSILDFIAKNNICTTFQFEIVVDLLSDDVIEYIEKLDNKFLRFEVGIQTTNDFVNALVSRRQNMTKIKQNIARLNKSSNVDIHVDLIAGLPLETKESFIKSFNETFFLKCKELQLGFLKFLRGTAILKDVEKYGYVYNSFPPYEIIESSTLKKDDFEEIKMVEKALNAYYNSGRFEGVFSYLFKENLIISPYNFFLGLACEFKNKQLYDLFLHFDIYMKEKFECDYNNIHFELIKDYLKNHKIKPKKWWSEKIENCDRKNIYEKILEKTSLITIHDLYEYSVVILNEDKCFIAIFKNHSPKFFEFTI